MMVPYGTYSPAAGLAAPGAYPYIGGPRYGYGSRYGYGPRFGYGPRYGYGPRFGYGARYGYGAHYGNGPLRLRPLARLTRSCFQVIGEGLRVPRRPSFLCGLYALTARLAT